MSEKPISTDTGLIRVLKLPKNPDAFLIKRAILRGVEYLQNKNTPATEALIQDALAGVESGVFHEYFNSLVTQSLIVKQGDSAILRPGATMGSLMFEIRRVEA